MKLTKNIMIEMNDGIKLAADLYLPDTDKPVPALINRNSNSGGSIFFEEKEDYIPAHNTVYHDMDHPSCIILPIVKR